ncbi:efflux transporter, RND family, MFP subunit, partial [Vibrio parahaemolyticus V-223/04]
STRSLLNQVLKLKLANPSFCLILKWKKRT